MFFYNEYNYYNVFLNMQSEMTKQKIFNNTNSIRVSITIIKSD